MKCLLFYVIFLTPLSALAQVYELKDSEISYEVIHLTHTVRGVSTAAKGKLDCSEAECALLVAVPIKTFDSGDSNRDHHMLEATRGELNPMIILKGSLPKNFVMTNESPKAELNLSFAGNERKIHLNKIQKKSSLNEFQVKFDFPISLTAFKVERPSLLMVPVKDEVKLAVSGDWILKK
jgi:hypothetical protein